MKPITRFAALLLTSLAIATPIVASAAISVDLHFGSGGGGGGSTILCNAGDICGIAANILFIINSVLVPVLFALAFIMFIYGVALKYVFSHGNSEKVEEGHRLILWGVVGFVVMISLWGLVHVVSNTFGLEGAYRPDLPTSY